MTLGFCTSVAKGSDYGQERRQLGLCDGLVSRFLVGVSTKRAGSYGISHSGLASTRVEKQETSDGRGVGSSFARRGLTGWGVALGGNAACLWELSETLEDFGRHSVSP